MFAMESPAHSTVVEGVQTNFTSLSNHDRQIATLLQKKNNIKGIGVTSKQVRVHSKNINNFVENPHKYFLQQCRNTQTSIYSLNISPYSNYCSLIAHSLGCNVCFCFHFPLVSGLPFPPHVWSQKCFSNHVLSGKRLCHPLCSWHGVSL